MQFGIIRDSLKKEDIFNFDNVLNGNGWYFNRLQFLDGLHFANNWIIANVEDEFIHNLREIQKGRITLWICCSATCVTVRIVGVVEGILPSLLFEGLPGIVGKFMRGSLNINASYRSIDEFKTALYGIEDALRNWKRFR
jgi:hypothetical protein